ncbi:26S protease regulatory subunit 7 [Fasciola gigantica]|uniref:26S protease regulatory subunit 7 n=1 Tax=Fasciola gigantica TaxID=46835 RepID=A0A504YSS5_FASGI|nr:26S protease regulatory subunit 7 [Fasciola gigantica]
MLSFEMDTVGGIRHDERAGGNKVQLTILKLINQLDVFDPRGSTKVLMANNHHNDWDHVLVSFVYVGQKVEFSFPDL